MGAWIEIQIGITGRIQTRVAPHMGAWIEIDVKLVSVLTQSCRTPHGCVD